MKKSKKFLCLLLALVMAGSLLLLPAAAANTQSGATRYPLSLIHIWYLGIKYLDFLTVCTFDRCRNFLRNVGTGHYHSH